MLPEKQNSLFVERPVILDGIHMRRNLQQNSTLVVPVGDENTQKMLRITRVEENEFTQESFTDFKFVPLLGKSGWEADG